MITRRNKSKTLKKIFHEIINVNLMVENVIQVKRGMKNCVDVRAKVEKSIIYVKKIKFGILADVLVK